MEVDISEFSLSFLPINNIITNYHACTSYRLYASITATILDKIVETHERSYVIFGRARIILFAPPHTPQFNVVDMIPMLRTCSCRIMSTLNWGRGGLQQKLWAFKSVEKGTRILFSKFQCVSTSFVQDCRCWLVGRKDPTRSLQKTLGLD